MNKLTKEPATVEDVEKNFLAKTRGITLIALVVTTVVLIILAAVSMYAVLSENGIIRKVEEAKELNARGVTIEKEALNTLYQLYVNATAESVEPVVRGANALAVADAPETYYGKVVNYEVRDSEYQIELNNEGIQWQIFHSDGNNIYLIASDYIPKAACPSGKKGTAIIENTRYKLGMTNAKNDYQGSADIIDNRLKALNSDYFNKGYSSECDNIKAVAYMMDISENVWGKYANSTYADYAIGGPTLELLVNSYNRRYNTNNYQASAINSVGYMISADGGQTWGSQYTYYFSPYSPYVISDTNKALYLWIASPASAQTRYLMMGASAGGLWCYAPYGTDAGFRPIVCR